jgi:2-keto-4-pentenoate hydratase/2-oxohepta-3-ene-1,7-dioic acid hydratase in catechol pathway
MKLLSFRRPDGTESWGILKDEGVIDLGSRAPGLKHALWATTSLAEEASRHADFKLADLTLLPPIPDPEKILCIGLNYVTHIKEGGRDLPPKPIVFTRYPNSQVGHGQAMVRPNISETFDYEGELAVIIGRRCRHVKKKTGRASSRGIPATMMGPFGSGNGIPRSSFRARTSINPAPSVPGS